MPNAEPDTAACLIGEAGGLATTIDPELFLAVGDIVDPEMVVGIMILPDFTGGLITAADVRVVGERMIVCEACRGRPYSDWLTTGIKPLLLIADPCVATGIACMIERDEGLPNSAVIARDEGLPNSAVIG